MVGTRYWAHRCLLQPTVSRALAGGWPSWMVRAQKGAPLSPEPRPWVAGLHFLLPWVVLRAVLGRDLQQRRPEPRDLEKAAAHPGPVALSTFSGTSGAQGDCQTGQGGPGGAGLGRRSTVSPRLSCMCLARGLRGPALSPGDGPEGSLSFSLSQGMRGYDIQQVGTWWQVGDRPAVLCPPWGQPHAP